MSKKKFKDWPYPGGYNHLLRYCDGKQASPKSGGVKVVCLDTVVKDGKSLNK